MDEETASFLSKSNKLQKFKKEQLDRNQVMIKLINPRNIRIVCEKSKMYNAVQELTNLIDKNKISSCIFESLDPMEVCFLGEQAKIREKEKSFKAEGVVVLNIDANYLEIKGTEAV